MILPEYVEASLPSVCSVKCISEKDERNQVIKKHDKKEMRDYINKNVSSNIKGATSEKTNKTKQRKQ